MLTLRTSRRPAAGSRPFRARRALACVWGACVVLGCALAACEDLPDGDATGFALDGGATGFEASSPVTPDGSVGAGDDAAARAEDSGELPDARSAVDASTGVDASTAADASTGVDASSGVDAGILVDAALLDACADAAVVKGALGQLRAVCVAVE